MGELDECIDLVFLRFLHNLKKNAFDILNYKHVDAFITQKLLLSELSAKSFHANHFTILLYIHYKYYVQPSALLFTQLTLRHS